MANQHNDDANSGYLAFSIDRTPSNSVKYQPYNKNQWNNNRNNFRGSVNFSPKGFSSPITNRPNNFRGNGGGGNNNFYQNNRQQNHLDGNGYNNNRSFHRGRGGGGGGGGNGGYNRSFNNSFSNNHHHHNNKPRFNQKNHNTTDEIDILSYVHPSMTEDPWKHFDLTKKNVSSRKEEEEEDEEENLNNTSLSEKDEESESISTN